jgi:hypothetical protein
VVQRIYMASRAQQPFCVLSRQQQHGNSTRQQMRSAAAVAAAAVMRSGALAAVGVPLKVVAQQSLAAAVRQQVLAG